MFPELKEQPDETRDTGNVRLGDGFIGGGFPPRPKRDERVPEKAAPKE